MRKLSTKPDLNLIWPTTFNLLFLTRESFNKREVFVTVTHDNFPLFNSMNTTVFESPFQCDPDAAKAIVEAVSKGFLEKEHAWWPKNMVLNGEGKYLQ